MHFDLSDVYCGTDLEILEMAASIGSIVGQASQYLINSYFLPGAIPLIKQDLCSTKGAMSNSLSGMYDMHSK